MKVKELSLAVSIGIIAVIVAHARVCNDSLVAPQKGNGRVEVTHH